MELTIRQGRHHQVRRLCRRGGLKLRHLRRLRVGPVGLGGLRPGEVRVLGREEKAGLYAMCLPKWLEQQGVDQARHCGASALGVGVLGPARAP